MRSRADRSTVEFGDFQTPPTLAAEVCRFLSARGIRPAAAVEPTCGIGRFVLSALDFFPGAEFLGVELNPAYLETLRNACLSRPDATNEKIRLVESNFFDFDWRSTLGALPEPLLILGNPPWVTNSRLGVLGGSNLPEKTNSPGLIGLDALTGKSNFDISEWMLVRLLELLDGRSAWLAMLCKTAVARKVLTYAWKNSVRMEWAEIRSIQAGKYFDAAVDACLLVCALASSGRERTCAVYRDLGDDEVPTSVIGYEDGRLIANMLAYSRWKHLIGDGSTKWRSGVKHDCSKVMELRKERDGLRNGLGELVELEENFVFPMLKSSDVVKGAVSNPSRRMIVPQRHIGDDTELLRSLAPKTWKYLTDRGEALDRRGSSIYRERPRFSVFGVGDYAFAPWKVAISGFYKELKFVPVGALDRKPIVFDDTVYFLPCRDEPEARLLADLYNSEVARAFFSAFLFWDAKRPITAELLGRLDRDALAFELGIDAKSAGVV